MTQRALDAQDKAARRSTILAAARSLYIADHYQLPSVARIATAAGLAKGTVYLYFRTKEEIFVGLLGAELSALLDEVSAQFSQPQGAPDIAQFIARYADYVDQHPELLRLDSVAYGVLEQNMSDEQLHAFKLELTHRLVQVGSVLDSALSLVPGRGTTLLMRSYALTRGLWQSLDYPPALRTLLAAAEFAPIRPNFSTELREALAEYWRGALASA